jgi:TFIIF-interacting CTD phosphatase-like protein
VAVQTKQVRKHIHKRNNAKKENIYINETMQKNTVQTIQNTVNTITHLDQDRYQWRAVLNANSIKYGEFLDYASDCKGCLSHEVTSTAV